MNNPINYRNKKPYKTAKYPIRQPIYLTWLIQFLSQKLLPILHMRELETTSNLYSRG